MKYLLDTKGDLQIPETPAPVPAFPSAEAAVAAALKWEQEVTSQITTLMDQAVKDNDYLVPRYYVDRDLTQEEEALVNGAEFVTLGELKARKVLTIRKGHEVGSHAYGTGDIPPTLSGVRVSKQAVVHAIPDYRTGQLQISYPSPMTSQWTISSFGFGPRCWPESVNSPIGARSVSPSRSVGTLRVDWLSRIQASPQTTTVARAPTPRTQP